MSFIWLPPAIASALAYVPTIAPVLLIGITFILFGELIVFLIQIVPDLLKLAIKISSLISKLSFNKIGFLLFAKLCK